MHYRLTFSTSDVESVGGLPQKYFSKFSIDFCLQQFSKVVIVLSELPLTPVYKTCRQSKLIK